MPVGHASDCSVNDGPAFVPGPCDCGLIRPVDPVEAFVPIVLVGARRGRLAVRERNVEALVKTEQTPINGGRGIRLTIDLVDAHRWPILFASSDHLDLND